MSASSLAPMIEEIFTDLAPLSDKRGVTLTAEGDGIMTGSDALIYRLIFNLTENAVKYNRPGGSVRVSVTQEPEKLLLRVSDTGCGIPEEHQRSIFQPFFRVDKSRSREYRWRRAGACAGVWEIAELHGGSVWVWRRVSDQGHRQRDGWLPPPWTLVGDSEVVNRPERGARFGPRSCWSCWFQAGRRPGPAVM